MPLIVLSYLPPAMMDTFIRFNMAACTLTYSKKSLSHSSGLYLYLHMFYLCVCVCISFISYAEKSLSAPISSLRGPDEH